MKGKINTTVDALSRHPSFHVVTVVNVDWKAQIIAKYVKNIFASNILDGQFVDDRYKSKDGLILYKNKIFLVLESKMKGKLLAALNDAPLAGHSGFYKSYRVLKEIFSWKGLKEDVLRHVRECVTCQQNKHENVHPAGLLQLLPILNHKWKVLCPHNTPQDAPFWGPNFSQNWRFKMGTPHE